MRMIRWYRSHNLRHRCMHSHLTDATEQLLQVSWGRQWIVHHLFTWTCEQRAESSGQLARRAHRSASATSSSCGRGSHLPHEFAMQNSSSAVKTEGSRQRTGVRRLWATYSGSCLGTASSRATLYCSPRHADALICGGRRWKKRGQRVVSQVVATVTRQAPCRTLVAAQCILPVISASRPVHLPARFSHRQ